MEGFYFNEELECHYCGYRFFLAGDRVIQFPTFCPECGETEVYRAKWNYDDDDEFEDTAEEADYGYSGSKGMLSIE